jgi:uncharacterized membrane protein (UPF0127 family)
MKSFDFVVVGAVLLGCQRVALSNPPAAAPSSPEATAPELPLAEVIVWSQSGSTPLQVEVADDDASRERGLMFRTQVPSGHGMLFVFKSSSNHTFWMKNTLVPLDMVFVGSDLRIVGIVENAEPQTTSPRNPGASSQYVLEVAGGTAFAHGWRAGDRLELHNVPAGR